MRDEPTVRKVVQLLEEAGFPRSNVYRREIKFDEGNTGFRCWSTRHRDAPGATLIAVAHYDRGQHWTDDKWAWHREWAQRKLMQYADAVTARGYVARLAFDREDPMVLVQGKGTRHA